MLTYCILAFFAQPVELCAVVAQFVTEVLDPIKGLLLFFGNKLLLGKGRVVIDGARQGRQRCGDLACRDGGVNYWSTAHEVERTTHLVEREKRSAGTGRRCLDHGELQTTASEPS